VRKGTRLVFGAVSIVLGMMIGSCTGWAIGVSWLNAHPEYDQGEDVLVCFVDAAIGGILGFIAGTAAAAKIHPAPRDASRYDLWIDGDGQDRDYVNRTVGALLGLDPTRARKLVDSHAPLLRGVRRAEADHLQARFSDFGLKIRVEPTPRSHG
jgi:ribosomal protein L7/L12